MVALFVILTFAFFIGLDLLLFRSKWAKLLREAPGTQEVPEDVIYNLPEVGLTMADGKPEEEEEEENKDNKEDK